MIYTYPCEVGSDDGGNLVVTFPDVPEAITGGQDRGEALRLATDALAAALAGYVHDERHIPEPSAAGAGQELIAVPPAAAAKLALHSCMRAQHITKEDLASRLGLSASAARKLTDPDQRSRMGQVQKALDAVGCRLVIDITAA